MQVELSVPHRDKYREVFDLLEYNNITSISIVNKDSEGNNLDFATYLLSQGDFDITLHYSTGYNYSGNLEELVAKFDRYTKKGRKIGVCKYLIVSGTQKRKYGSLDVLRLYETNPEEKIYCACNPYLPQSEVEIKKLFEKLQYCDGVYFQIGENTARLHSVINNPLYKKMIVGKEVYGCLLFPTGVFLKRFSFRPWKGVYLSDKYLSVLDYARKVFYEYKKYYKSHSIVPLLEVMPLNQQNLTGTLQD